MSEYARRIGNGGRGGVVSISELIRNGVDPRSYNYRCIDEKCDAPVFPAVPDKVKPGRLRSPSPYFRAGPSERHKDGCMRGAIEERIINAQQQGHGSGALVDGEHAISGGAPVRFVEKSPVKTVGGGGKQSSGDDGADEQRARTRGRGDGGGASEASSKSIEKFVDVYENPPIPHDQLPISIKGCPAKTFAETFISPIEGASLLLNSDIRHIYRGQYDRHEHWKTGISLYFKETVNGLPLSVWIPNTLEPASVLNRLIDRIQVAESVRDATLYVLGRFVPKFNHGKYAIELISPYQCWIHIPNP